MHVWITCIVLSACYIIYITSLSVPRSVSEIHVQVLNTSAVRITWSPVEEANGNITHYIVSVSLYEGRELYRDISVSSDLQVIVNGFGECFFIHYHFGIFIHCYCIVGETPYIANVKALNNIGQEGLPNQTLFFTEEDGRYNVCSYIDSIMCNPYFSSSCSE